MWPRIVLNFILAASILFLPWWVSVLTGVLMLFLFEAYEIVVWGFVADQLYSVPNALFFNIEFLFTITFALLLFSISKFKKYVIFY